MSVRTETLLVQSWMCVKQGFDHVTVTRPVEAETAAEVGCEGALTRCDDLNTGSVLSVNSCYHWIRQVLTTYATGSVAVLPLPFQISEAESSCNAYLSVQGLAHELWWESPLQRQTARTESHVRHGQNS